METCGVQDCSNPKHADSVRGLCKEHHLVHQETSRVEYFSVPEVLAQRRAKVEQGNWFPANGGTETPFTTRERRRLLYCWQPSTGRHAYLDLDTDLILSDSDAQLALGV